MDKIDKLIDTVVKGDKSYFIHCIHDFSEEDIIGLTDQEFEKILEYCAKIKIKGVDEFFEILIFEGNQALENSRIDQIKENALKARFYLSILLVLYSKRDSFFAAAMESIGITYTQFAEFGIEPEKNLERSIKSFKEARKIFQKNTLDYARATRNLGGSYGRLAEFGVDPKKNLGIAIKLEGEARKFFPKNSLNYATIISNMGVTHLRFAELGIEAERNLKESIKLFQESRTILPKNELDYANVALNKGYAHMKLAALGVEAEKNLKESIKLEDEAREIFPKDNVDYASATLNKGISHADLAELGNEPEKNFEVAKNLQQEARKIYLKNSWDYALTSMNLGNVHVGLAELGIEPKENLEESIKLFQEAREIFSKNSPSYARTTMNQGYAHLWFAEVGIKLEENFKIAEELYKLSGGIFLDIKDGWGYPLAVLNLHALYRSIFWKNGDKNFLEKAKNSLEEAKKIIETWDVLRKNEILGTLFEVESDLCLLEDNYYSAGMNYRDAYRITQNEYYRFMCEFCAAKSSREKDSFYKLADRWKEVDKKGIFLDFYNYSVFECYLEEAVENEALRFDQVKKAKGKLDEIHARTRIYHVKIRVGACIDILNAYLNYFPEKESEKNDEKTIGCISSACRTFKSLGNKPEIELCNMFSKAIKNKDSQEVWIDLIKNHLSNNLSKLIGVAAIDERRKLETREIKSDLLDIKAGIIEIKANIEEFKTELKTRFDRIEKDMEDIAQSDDVLRDLLIGYANRTHGILLKLLDESKNCDLKTQELMRDFSEDITRKLEERDEKWFEKLKDELIKKEKEIEETLSSAPPEIKSKWHQFIDKLKKETKEIIREIPHEAIVIVGTEKILEYGAPFLSAAMSSPAAIPALIAILYTTRMVVSKGE